MPRPQKYTDSEIMAATQALIVEGGEINPMRVRMRLGGGNVSRIKAVVAKLARQEPLSASPSGLPQTLVRELQQMSSEASQQFLSVVARYWTSTLAESAGPAREENAALRRQIDDLEREALASSERLAQAERQRDEMDRAMKQIGKERDELAQNFEGLQSALRNAESDFRAAQRMIDTFERNRREDRDEIRDFQKRIEDLVGEIALLRVKATSAQPKVRSRGASTFKSRVG